MAGMHGRHQAENIAPVFPNDVGPDPLAKEWHQGRVGGHHGERHETSVREDGTVSSTMAMWQGVRWIGIGVSTQIPFNALSYARYQRRPVPTNKTG